MAIVVNMPRLSDTMEEGTVATWLKKVGDQVQEGDILAEIETDKATMEFESFNEGVLLHIGVQEGDSAPVDTLLAIIGEKGEDISSLLSGTTEAPAQAEAPKAEEAKIEPTAVAALPSGVEIITMPRLSDTMEEGTVASWLKKVGDEVNEGDILAEIETDKATMEFESFYTGTLLHIGLQEGESAPVDSVLAIVGPAGTDVSAVIASGSQPKAVTTTQEAPKEQVAEAPKTVPKAEVAPTTNTSGRIFASPLAKKLAAEKGVDLAQVQGSGEKGRIIKADIENFTPVAAPAAQATATVATSGVESKEEVKNSQMRKVIAKRLGESKFTAPHYYLTIEVNMDNAIASRKQINNLPDTKVSFNDMVLKASAMALQKHPQVNTSWNGDTTIYNKHIHMGVAVAVTDGLVVPVIPFADSLQLTQIGSSVRDLASKIGRAHV